MTQTSSFRRGLLFGSTALTAFAALAAAPAMAQDAANAAPATVAPSATADQGGAEEIVVTGTILRRTNTETASPVTVLSAQTLEQRGINTVADAVTRIPANGSGTIPANWNAGGFNFATGATAVSLRGLTAQATLTLFDGLRMAPYPFADDGHRNFVDLNTIPDAVVSQVEVLKDSASSTYGADAIAGVVNVITKRQITGIHLNGSAGITEHGDGAEQRLDATVGYGDLDDKGFNIYVNGEYQRDEPVLARDRSYPFNTSDLSRICSSGTDCLPNGLQFGINANGTLNGNGRTIALIAAPASATGTQLGVFQLLNPAAGCYGGTTPITLTPAQQASGLTYAPQQCQQDLYGQYGQITEYSQRYGFNTRATVKIGDRAEAYVSGTYYDVHTITNASIRNFNDATPPPSSVTLSPVYLPVYICPTGVGEPTGLATGCTAANGTLNPANPFAALGERAILRGRYINPPIDDNNARSLRGAIGIKGSFGNDWTYSADFTASNVRDHLTYKNVMIPQLLLNAIATGSYNFLDQRANTQAQFDSIAPPDTIVAESNLWQAQATLGKALFNLPGGAVQAAVGVSYRHESINDPSANPDDPTHPYDRYYGYINAVGAAGSRNVKSAFFEIDAPILDILEVNGSGRYDDYSSGQKNFSPKIGAKFTPIKQVALRGTYSRGFRIPSFNEAFGLPTTGYVTTSVNCATFAAFCAAHGNDAYVTNQYSVGQTSTGNPSLDPEKSRSYTLGAIVQPTRWFDISVDYWHIKVNGLITSVSAPLATVAADYYANNGVVNDIPGITVVQGQPDPEHPGALPLLGFVQSSFRNADSEVASGIDFAANARVPIGDRIKLTSRLDASYLIKYNLTPEGGDIQKYAGTLGPCEYTSCSGSPKWRGTWQNTLDVDNFEFTATAYYTSGYDLEGADDGGIPGDCAGSIGAEIVAFPSGTPVSCHTKATWNVDLAGSIKVGDHFTFYANILNAFNIKPPFDPSAAYSLTQYNPAWASANILGRFFRFGAKVDF